MDTKTRSINYVAINNSPTLFTSQIKASCHELLHMQQIPSFMATPFVWLAINKYEAKLGQTRRELVIDKGISPSLWRLAEMNHLAEEFSYAPTIKLLDCRQVRLLAARDDHFLGQSGHCCSFSLIRFRRNTKI